MNERPCTITESIIQSCKEVKAMREGKSPKRNLNDLFANIENNFDEEDNKQKFLREFEESIKEMMKLRKEKTK